MKKQVYFCTSQHFHPVHDPKEPLCLVWVAVEGHYNKIRLKIYRSYNFPLMMKLSRRIAKEHNIKLAVISTNISQELIYQINVFKLFNISPLSTIPCSKAFQQTARS